MLGVFPTRAVRSTRTNFYREDGARLCLVCGCCWRPELLFPKQLPGSRCGVLSTNSAQPLPSPWLGREPSCRAASCSLLRWHKDLWDMSPLALNDSFQSDICPEAAGPGTMCYSTYRRLMLSLDAQGNET